MKLLCLVIALALALVWPAAAQTNATPATDPLRELVQKIQTKIMDHKTAESDYTAEIKDFDALIAARKATDPEGAAQASYMKAKLYLEIFENPEQSKVLFQALNHDYPDTKYGKEANHIVEAINKQVEAKKIQAALVKGSTFPDFSEKDLAGAPLSPSALKGKVVLVDFWATWCGPCRAELPNVIAAYQKHHKEGFEIIGVSLDSDRDKLDAFLKKTEGMTWPQYFDGQGWGNKLAAQYGVESIPFAVLIGKDGKIIGKELRGEALETAIAAALK